MDRLFKIYNLKRDPLLLYVYIIKINKVNYGWQHFTWNRKFMTGLLGNTKPTHEFVIIMYHSAMQ